MELGKSDRDLVGLSVLALLLAGPKHTYEMHRMMVDTRKDFVTGLPRSMYHAVERLEKAGHIIPVETVREGPKPERTVYALTDPGRAEVHTRVERLLSLPDTDATLFRAALSFITGLPPRRAAAALRTRLDALARRIAELDADLTTVRPHIPRVLIVEDEYELRHTRWQHAWVEQLLAEIDAGDLTWPDDVTAWATDPEMRRALPTEPTEPTR